MQATFVKSAAVVAVLSLCAASAMAGTIDNSSVGMGSSALQNIGVAEGNGVIRNSSVRVTGATNTAAGMGTSSTQRIGVAR